MPTVQYTYCTMKHTLQTATMLNRYTSIPPVSRIYFTSAFLTTSFCAMDLLNPYKLYFDHNLIIVGQVWRLFSSFLFFGLLVDLKQIDLS